MLGRTLSAFVNRRLGSGGVWKTLLQSLGLSALLVVIARFVMMQVSAAALFECIPPDLSRWKDPSLYRPELLCDAQAWTLGGVMDVLAMGTLAAGLLLIVPVLVSAQVAGERKQGTLEQLRGTPVSAMDLLFAHIVGGPARILVLLIGPLLLHVGYALGSDMPAAVFVGSVTPLFVGGFALTLIGVAAALSGKRSAGLLGGLLLGALIAICGLVAYAMICELDRQLMSWLFLHPLSASLGSLFSYDGPWRHLFVRSWRMDRFDEPMVVNVLALLPVASTLLFAAVSTLLLPAVARRLQREELPLLGKRTAALSFAVLAVAVIAPGALVPGFSWHDYAARYALAYGFLLLPVAAILVVVSMPTRELWSMGLRRARLGWFADARSPHLLGVLMVGTFVGLMLVQHGSIIGASSSRVYEGQAVAWGLWLALMLPTLWQYHVTRTERGGGYLFVVGVFLLVQVIGITLVGVGDGARPGSHPIATLVARIALVLGVGLPLVVAWLQRRVTRAALGTPELAE